MDGFKSLDSPPGSLFPSGRMAWLRWQGLHTTTPFSNPYAPFHSMISAYCDSNRKRVIHLHIILGNGAGLIQADHAHGAQVSYDQWLLGNDAQF